MCLNVPLEYGDKADEGLTNCAKGNLGLAAFQCGVRARESMYEFLNLGLEPAIRGRNLHAFCGATVGSG